MSNEVVVSARDVAAAVWSVLFFSFGVLSVAFHFNLKIVSALAKSSSII